MKTRNQVAFQATYIRADIVSKGAKVLELDPANLGRQFKTHAIARGLIKQQSTRIIENIGEFIKHAKSYPEMQDIVSLTPTNDNAFMQMIYVKENSGNVITSPNIEVLSGNLLVKLKECFESLKNQSNN